MMLAGASPRKASNNAVIYFEKRAGVELIIKGSPNYGSAVVFSVDTT